MARIVAVLCFGMITLLLSPLSARADWQPNGIPVCSDLSDQGVTATVSDGAGGVIVIWLDYRNSKSADIYAQHVLASGVVDPAYSADGNLVCNAPNEQYTLAAISDGAGGAIVAWQDLRGGANSDIYVQRVLATGATGWFFNGVLLCDAVNEQQNPTLVSDGTGGVIVAWSDERNSGDTDIYAQHVVAAGTVDPNWTANGTLLCNANNIQSYPSIVSDGAGGAIVAWQDPRMDASDIYAQHVLASGIVDASWPPNGAIVCDEVNTQNLPQAISDGAGGAFVTWQDLRAGASSDIYAQHLAASGVVDPSWPVNGTALSSAVNNQTTPLIVPGAGGAIVVWQDFRGGLSSDLYAQHVLGTGAVDPSWTANGTLLCDAANSQQNPVVVSDGAGGAIVAWADIRNGVNSDIYAQRVLASGVVDPGWPANGTLVCNAANNQRFPSIASNGAAGAIVAWSDDRVFANGDVYAQRVLADGRTPTLVSLARTLADARHVLLDWLVSDGAGRTATVWRRSADSEWKALATVTADGTGHIVYDDLGIAPGARYGYRLGIHEPNHEAFLGETWVDVPLGATLSLQGLRPNPGVHDLMVSFSLASREPATLELFDTNGRRVFSHVLRSPDPGSHIVNLGGRGAIASGAYVLRLTQGRQSVATKAVVLR